VVLLVNNLSNNLSSHNNQILTKDFTERVMINKVLRIMKIPCLTEEQTWLILLSYLPV
jgi:hypothetical protein